MPLEFQVHDETGSGLDPDSAGRAVEAVLSGEGLQADNINLILLPREKLREMKQQYFHMDQYTDVIAFNLNDEDESCIEGELYISPEQIAENAESYGVDYEQELYRVIIHGVLHLSGYEDDTAEQKNQMRKREDHYLETLAAGGPS